MPEQDVLGTPPGCLKRKAAELRVREFFTNGLRQPASARTGDARRKSQKLGGNWFSLRLSADDGRRSVAGYTEGRPYKSLAI
jgi:hypothetical protein